MAQIRVQRRQDGAVVAACPGCGAQYALHPHLAAQQAASLQQQHAACPEHYGLGDLVAKATSAVGIKPCQPCKQRQAALNRMAPRVWRR